MRRVTRMSQRVPALLLALVIILPGCRSRTNITPTAGELGRLSAAVGFLAARVEKSGGFIAGADQRERASEYAYLYDNALAAMVLATAGARWHAECIADAIVFAQEHDRSFRDGRLRNAYVSGDPKSDSGRSIAAGKVAIRLPGFWKDGRWQEDYHTVSTSTGNMAWAILALVSVARGADEAKRGEYLAAACRAADFVLELESASGGFTAGHEGWDDVQTKVSYKATEHNIDLITAFASLGAALADDDPQRAAVYAAAAEHAERFVLAMHDPDLHCFYTGTEADGVTISDGVIPLDTNSLAVLTLGERLDDAGQTIAFVENRMAVGEGFDFSAGDLDGIWNEGTAQMAVCYSLLGDQENYDRLMSYLKTQAYRDGSVPAADRDGVSTGFQIVGTDILGEYNNVLSISATAWYALAELEINPFDPAQTQAQTG